VRRLRPPALVAVLAAGLLLAVVAPSLPELVRPGLPPVSDGTGLSGAGLRAADSGDPEVVRLAVDGRERAYLLAPARRVEAGARPGLLLALPAVNRTVRDTYEALGLDAWRDHGLTVVVASALDGWNAGACCGGSADAGVDDVGALAAVTRDAAERTEVDLGRTAVLGYSTGGFMVYRLVCEGGLPLRAAVEVAGSLAVPCRPQGPTPPLLAVHGSLDRTVPLEASSAPVPVLGTTPLGVREAVRRVRAACPGGCPVELVELAGAGHRWEDLRPQARVAAFLAATVPGVR
jgi:poly(3-hydroxybutyrate) depolymerase